MEWSQRSEKFFQKTLILGFEVIVQPPKAHFLTFSSETKIMKITHSAGREQLLSFACVSKSCLQLDIGGGGLSENQILAIYLEIFFYYYFGFDQKLNRVLFTICGKFLKYLLNRDHIFGQYATYHYIVQKLPDKLFKYVLEYVHRWHTFSSQHCVPFKNCTYKSV